MGTEKFSYFEITINLEAGGQMQVAAKTLDGDKVYKAVSPVASRVVFEEVLSKLAIAIHGLERDTLLEINDKDGAADIVRDMSFLLPACNATKKEPADLPKKPRP
jgi:hypothetical protein